MTNKTKNTLLAFSVVACVVAGSGCNSGNTPILPDPFIFADEPRSAYSQVDSHAMPEVGTALIEAANGLSGTALRDTYNATSPTDRADTYNAEILNSLTLFHSALDDDLTGLGLDPATPDEALAQGAPLVVPEVMRYDPSEAASFPNGRALEDPVVDITLAVVLLDLAAPGQTTSTFASLPLNPPANDKPMLAVFPYVPPPHEP